MNTKAQPPLARPAADQRRRTWARLLLIVTSAVTLLAAVLLLTLFCLFTSAKPLALPETNVTPEDRDDLTRRWLDVQPHLRSIEVRDNCVVFTPQHSGSAHA